MIQLLMPWALLSSGIIHAFIAAADSSPANPASKKAWFTPCYDGEAWRFRTGFDGTTRLIQLHGGKSARFEGTSQAAVCPTTTRSVSSPRASLGRLDIQYEGGDDTQRLARIVPDPLNPDDQVLEFWLAQANVTGPDGQPLKGRVQMNVYENRGVRRLWLSVRMFLPRDMESIRSYPKPIDWLTISEWWNNASWTEEPYPFRISVHINKETGDNEAPLRFMVKADAQSGQPRRGRQGGGRDEAAVPPAYRPAAEAHKVKRWDQDYWQHVNREFSIPVGQWMTLEYLFVEGDKNNGRFFMAVTPDKGTRQVLFDIRDHTHHPDDPAPDGLRHLNPIKLYTSAQLIDHVRSRGGALQILWDDLDMVAD